MHAFLINLPHAADRLSHAKAQLEQAGIPYSVVEAINGKALSYPHLQFNEPGYQLKQGRRRVDPEVGCYLSHMKAIQAFLDTGEKFGLILEDDIHLPPYLVKLIDEAFKQADFDMLRLSTVNSGRWSKTAHLMKSYYLGVAFTREKGAGAYVINRKAAKRMAKRFQIMSLPYDHRFDLEWLDGYRTMGITPAPVKQSGFDSQIQNNMRAYYLPAYIRYWTVFPYRFFWEVTRIVSRGYSYLKLQTEKDRSY